MKYALVPLLVVVFFVLAHLADEIELTKLYADVIRQENICFHDMHTYNIKKSQSMECELLHEADQRLRNARGKFY